MCIRDSHNIYKNLPVGIELYDKDGQMVDLNKKDMEMFRISNKEDILGVNIFENPISVSYTHLPTDIG